MPCSPLPAISIPPQLIEQRKCNLAELFARFNEPTDLGWRPHAKAPGVGQYLAPLRSAPIALAGVAEMIRVEGLHFPPIVPVRGLGHEIYHQYEHEMAAAGRYEELPLAGIGMYAEYEERLPFWAWIADQVERPTAVAAAVQALRANVNPTAIAILDDTVAENTITYGIAPGMFRATWGRKGYTYVFLENHKVFTRPNWIKDIMEYTFARERKLNEAAIWFLVLLAKGEVDSSGWADTSAVVRRLPDVGPLVRRAALYANWDEGNAAEEKRPDDVIALVETYGAGLEGLHNALKAALRETLLGGRDELLEMIGSSTRQVERCGAPEVDGR